MNPALEFRPQFPHEEQLDGWIDKSPDGTPGVRTFVRGEDAVVLVLGVQMWDVIHLRGGEVEYGLLHPDEVVTTLNKLTTSLASD